MRISLDSYLSISLISFMKKLLKPSEAAKFFGISIRTLYDWSSAGTVPTVKINGALRFDLDEISNWIEMHKRPVNRKIKKNEIIINK